MPGFRMLLLLVTLLTTTASLVNAIPISGRVRVDGVDAAGATVSVFSMESRWSRSERWLSGEADPPPVSSVRTGKDGVFER